MGGGASSMSMEELLQTTMAVGRAIASITFPGMYRIYDFHSPKAPRLRNARQFVFFADESDEEDEEDAQEPLESEYAHFFKVMVQDEAIYLEDPLRQNEAGWTALHTCCMSFITVPAGQKIIDEIVRLGASLDCKTKSGPGTFNRGWTPLHMACAYGVEPLVDRLLQHGADANTTNSFGYTPLLEACHRGFVAIVASLIKANARLDHIPNEDASCSSPFAAAPAHCALGEAARCGFLRIVQTLLDAGAPKDQINSLGWSPLHEACFYNRIEVVKVLLLAGADATKRTRIGALPYHLSGLQTIRAMLKDMGGAGAEPEAGDVIDMVDVLHELTMQESMIMQSALDEEERDEGGGGARELMDGSAHDYSNFLDDDDDDDEGEDSPQSRRKSFRDDEENSTAMDKQVATGKKNKGRKQTPKANRDEEKLLHCGRLLGDLPSLENRSSPGGAAGMYVDRDMSQALEFPERASPSGLMGANREPSRKADDKVKKKKKNRGDPVPPDMPKEFLCQLSQRPMSDPVKTIYNNVFDRTVISNWFSQQGRVCPLTGAPLAETDLKPLPELGDKIRAWILDKSSTKEASTSGGAAIVTPEKEKSTTSAASAASKAAEDDLYDF